MPEGYKMDGMCTAPGVVYLSTELDSGTEDHARWFRLFVARLILDTRALAERFGTVVLPNGGLPGDLVPKGSKFREDLSAQNTVVAAVSILTTPYISAAVEGVGEFPQLVAAAGGVKDAFPGTDPEVPLQVFLAPLDHVWWDRYKVNGVRLDDKRFTRLQDERFMWPGLNPAVANTEIDKASLKVVTEKPGEE